MSKVSTYFCSQCHVPLDDGGRGTWAEHCAEAHPELAEVARQSDLWDESDE